MENAERDAKGRFGRQGSEGSEALHPGCHAGYEGSEPAELGREAFEPAELGYRASEPAHIVVADDAVVDASPEKLKRWEKHVETAMEDLYWLEMVAMQTKLPVFERKTEIVELFKRHVIVQAKEEDILSVKDAKSYFANCTRIGSPMHKRLLEELERNTQWVSQTIEKKDVYRYEDRDPRTGKRSYYGIAIPEGTPPRPSEEAVLINGLWT